MSKLLFVSALVLLTGCAQLNELTGRAYDEIGSSILSYCQETSPSMRAEWREGVNEAAAPASVEITCP